MKKNITAKILPTLIPILIIVFFINIIHSQYQGENVLKGIAGLQVDDVESIKVRYDSFGTEVLLRDIPEDIMLSFISFVDDVDWAMGTRPPKDHHNLFVRINSSKGTYDFEFFYHADPNKPITFDLIEREYHSKNFYTQENYGSFKSKSIAKFLGYLMENQQ